MVQAVVRRAQASDRHTITIRTTKTRCSRREVGWPTVKMLSNLFVLLALFADGRITWVSCNQAKQIQELQQQQQQQQQQTVAQPQSLESNPGSQGSYYGDYALVADNLINLGQPYFNNKRARKFSAFMPMRGRKDGRDAHLNSGGPSVADGSLVSSQDGEFLAPLMPFREIDGGETSILRLVRASLAGAGADQATTGTAQWMGSPGPRQFANQLAARHMLIGGPQSITHQFSASNPLEVSEGYLYGSGEPTGLMQAKPRRAFHPMRGKKSETLFAAPELDFNDIEMQTDI